MRLLFRAGLVICVIALALLGLSRAGAVLVVDRPQRSDVILVLVGDADDLRYWKAVELLRAGYAPLMLLDARSDQVSYGRTPVDMAEAFVKRTAGELAGRIRVCPTTGNSTRLEMQSATGCFGAAAPRTILLVTSDYHTRRALSIARKACPRYSWSVAATDTGLLSTPRWWSNREIVKTVFVEWQKLAWWELVESHK